MHFFKVIIIFNLSFSNPYTKYYFLLGNTDQEQLAKIFNVLGTPTEENWPDVTLLPQYIEFETREPLNLITLFKPSNESDKDNKVIHQDLDLLLKMLSLNPNQRITASQVSIYFINIVFYLSHTFLFY